MKKRQGKRIDSKVRNNYDKKDMIEEEIKTFEGILKAAKTLLKIPEKERLKISAKKKLKLTDEVIKSDIKELENFLDKIKKRVKSPR